MLVFAENLKFDAGKLAIKNTIMTQYENFKTAGQFDLKKYKAILKQNGIPIKDFERDMIDQIKMNKMNDLFAAMQFSKSYVEDSLRFKNTTAKVMALSFDKEEMTKNLNVKNDEVQAFLKDESKSKAILNSLFSDYQKQTPKKEQKKLHNFILSPYLVNPRDQVLIYGDEIIETSCIWRMRYFENDLMKDIFREYFLKGAKWSCSPRPVMNDESYDFDFKDKLSEIENGPFKQFEIMFDGAQCLKFGEDILMNISNRNHYLGYLWLKSHLGKEANVHPVCLTDHHIDGMLMPLAPGTLLINASSMKQKLDRLPLK